MGIRELSLEDAGALETVRLQRQRMRRDPEHPAGEESRDWTRFFSRSGSHGWGYFREGILLGTVFLRPDPRQPIHSLLSGLWVDERQRRRGLGRHLSVKAIQFAEMEAYQVIKLWVTETNHPACLLYASLGFHPTGRLRAVPHDPFVHLQQYSRQLNRTRTVPEVGLVHVE